MTVVLICPSNFIHMPYLSNYINILQEHKDIDFVIINWDRFGIEEESDMTFRDDKIGHARGIYDYYQFSCFVKKILSSREFDRAIVFGLQLMLFIGNYIIKNFRESYILDIRDYNIVKKLFSFNSIINNSVFTVISSPGYKAWLPKNSKYIVSHNAVLNDLNNLGSVRDIDKENIKISCIGAIKDLSINLDLIEELRHHERFEISYRGEGVINKDLIDYVFKNKIKNVSVSGRYNKKEESRLYEDSDIINMIMNPNSINNNTCLSNRLYNSTISGRPLIALKGSLISQMIDYYQLGLVISSTSGMAEEIDIFVSEYDASAFNINRKRFLKQVIEDNIFFKQSLINFIK